MRDDVLEIALNARVIFVMGGVDTGKTIFVKNLANELFRRRFSVGVIDADVGQSDIGPPTTIGLGTVEAELETLGDALLRHGYFVGSTSPKGHLLPMVVGVRKMLDKANDMGLQKIIFDTTGLISGQLGRVLKEYKIEAINPDVILCLQARRECEHILQAYHGVAQPQVLRLAPDSQCRRKAPEARREYRETAFKHYFAQAKEVVCALSDIGIFGTAFMSGQSLSKAGLQTLSENLEHETTKTRPQILWGEYLHQELFLLTTYPLRSDDILTLKQCCPDVDYIRNETLAEFENLLVGILDDHNEFVALGILRSLDLQTRQALVYTPAKPEEIKGLKFSRFKMSAQHEQHP